MLIVTNGGELLVHVQHAVQMPQHQLQVYVACGPVQPKGQQQKIAELLHVFHQTSLAWLASTTPHKTD